MWMQRTDLADQVKSLVTIQDVAEHYGFHPNRAGYICCPFHREKSASLKLYSDQRGWCCFGCGAGGTVIDFVMKLFDIPFRQAILRINADFALGLTWDKPDPAVRSAILEARRPGGPAESEAGTVGGKAPGAGCGASVLVGGAEVFCSHQRRLEGGVYPSALR